VCSQLYYAARTAATDLWNGLAVRRKLAELELAFLDSPNELDPCNRGRRMVE
jgi:hypothetical protein